MRIRSVLVRGITEVEDQHLEELDCRLNLDS